MKRIFRPITVQHGETTKQIYININLIEYIEETDSAVFIKMQHGNGWLVYNESIQLLIERLQSN
jgi:uncharacterized protein YlzI (FlbEa/FlbD family)